MSALWQAVISPERMFQAMIAITSKSLRIVLKLRNPVPSQQSGPKHSAKKVHCHSDFSCWDPQLLRVVKCWHRIQITPSPAISFIEVHWFLDQALADDADPIATFAAITNVLKEAARQYYADDEDSQDDFDVGFLNEINVEPVQPNENLDEDDEEMSDATTERLG